MRFFKPFSIAVIILTALFYCFFSSHQYQKFEGKIFGTYYHIKIKSQTKNKDLNDLIKLELENINKSMSMFEENSELSLINKSPKEKWLTVSPDLYKVLITARTVWQQSDGAFDPTVGPLVNLWGFGPDNQRKHPNEKQIQKVLQFTGLDKLRFDDNKRRLKKLNTQTGLDLSAIAKGYGVDRIAALLHEEGYHDFVVEIGGEVRASGNKSAAEEGWVIGIARPTAQKDDNLLILSLQDSAIATSGDYHNFYVDEKGNKISHTISPRSGKPVAGNLASVTVIAPECMLADAYATAIMALGEEKGMAFADRNQLEALLFIREEDGNFTIRYSQPASHLKGE